MPPHGAVVELQAFLARRHPCSHGRMHMRIERIREWKTCKHTSIDSFERPGYRKDPGLFVFPLHMELRCHRTVLRLSFGTRRLIIKNLPRECPRYWPEASSKRKKRKARAQPLPCAPFRVCLCITVAAQPGSRCEGMCKVSPTAVQRGSRLGSMPVARVWTQPKWRFRPCRSVGRSTAL